MTLSISRDAFLQCSRAELIELYSDSLKAVIHLDGVQRREKSERATTALCVLGKTPAGAELALWLLTTDVNVLGSQDAWVIEQEAMVALNLCLDSLRSFPLQPITKGPELEWYQSTVERWHDISDKAKQFCESIVAALLCHSEPSAFGAIAKTSIAIANKLQQLTAELCLWFHPNSWTSLNDLIIEAFNKRAAHNYLLPSTFLLNLLREIATQLTAGPDNFGTIDTTRRSAWEIGRLTSTQRSSLATQISLWLSFAWQRIAEDVQYINASCTSIPPNHHFALFAEVVQLMVPLLVSTQNTAKLSEARWAFFSDASVIASEDCRPCMESLVDCALCLSTKKGRFYHFDEISVQSLTDLWTVVQTSLQHITSRSHPLLGFSADEDDLHIVSRLCPALCQMGDRFDQVKLTSLLTRDAPSLLTTSAMLIAHPSLVLANHGVNLLQTCLPVLSDEIIMSSQFASLINVLLVRQARYGDGSVSAYRSTCGETFLDGVCIEILSSCLKSFNIAIVAMTTTWWNLVEQQNQIDEFVFTDGGAFLQRLAALRQTTNSLIKKDHPPLLTETIAKTMHHLCTSMMKSEAFSREAIARSFKPDEPHLLKRVPFKMRGFLSPVYTALDLLLHLAEIPENGLMHQAAIEVLRLACDIPLSFLDTDTTLSDDLNRVIVDTGKVSVESLPSHWGLLELRRLDGLVSAPSASSLLRPAILPFLLKRVLAMPPETWPQTHACATSGTLDEEEDTFYLIRRRAVKCLHEMYVSCGPAARAEVEQVLSVLAARSTLVNLSDAERTFLSESALALASSIGSAEVERLAFEALGPPLLTQFVMTLGQVSQSPISLAQFLTGAAHNGDAQLTLKDRRRLLRNINTCETVLNRLALPNTYADCLAGKFIQTSAPSEDSLPQLLTSHADDCRPLDVQLNSPLQPLVEACLPGIARMGLSYLSLWGLAVQQTRMNSVSPDSVSLDSTETIAVALRSISEEDVQEISKTRKIEMEEAGRIFKFPSGLYMQQLKRHLTQLRLVLFRLLGTLIRVYISIKLHSADSTELLTVANTLKSMMASFADDQVLEFVPPLVKEMVYKHVFANGFLHALSCSGLPAHATDVVPVAIDPSCFFFPCTRAVSLHSELLRNFTQICLPKFLHSSLMETAAAEASRKKIVKANDETAAAVHQLRWKQSISATLALTQIVGNIFTLTSDLPTKAKKTTKEEHPDDAVSEDVKTVVSHLDFARDSFSILSLRVLLHTALKRECYADSDIVNSALTALITLLQIPHQDVTIASHLIIRSFVRTCWKRIGVFVLHSMTDKVAMRRCFDRFAEQCKSLFERVLAQCFSAYRFDPQVLSELSLDVLGPDALAIALPMVIQYHMFGGSSDSSLKPFLSLPLVDNTNNHRLIAVNANLGANSFYTHSITTLYEIVRAMASAFIARCNLLVLDRMAFAPETTREEVLIQISLVPSYATTLAYFGDAQLFPCPFNTERFTAWLKNVAAPRNGHDSKVCKDDIRFFILSNLNAMIGGEDKDRGHWMKKAQSLGEGGLLESDTNRVMDVSTNSHPFVFERI